MSRMASVLPWLPKGVAAETVGPLHRPRGGEPRTSPHRSDRSIATRFALTAPKLIRALLAPARFLSQAMLYATVSLAPAQTVPTPSISVALATTPVKLDGLLDDSAWTEATAVVELTQQSPRPGV